MRSSDAITRRHILGNLAAVGLAPALWTSAFTDAKAQVVIRHGRGARVPAGLRNRMQVQQLAAEGLEARLSANHDLGAILESLKSSTPTGVSPTDAQFDWRKLNKVTKVRDQGSCGSCYIFAAIGAFESAYVIANNGVDPTTIEVSEQEILDCGIAETNCVVGGWHEYVFTYLQTLGAVGASSYLYNSYNPQRGVYCVSDWGTRPFFLRNWGYVSATSIMPTVSELKQAIVTHGPVVCGVNAVSDGSVHDWDRYTGGVLNSVPTSSNDADVNHEVVIVGWDDKLQGPGVPPGVWIVINSWGIWPSDPNSSTCSVPPVDQGYVYVPYNRNNIGQGASWVSAWPAQATTLLTQISEELKVKELQQVK